MRSQRWNAEGTGGNHLGRENMKIGIQTNAWSEDIHYGSLQRLVSEVAQAGYDGLEIGAQRLNIAKPDSFRKLVGKYNLNISGIHTSGPLFNMEGMQPILANLGKTAEFALAAGAHNLMFSGQPKDNKTEDEFKIEAEMLNQVGSICKKAGIPVQYHNHAFEILNEMREYKALMSLTDPDLVSFCLDIGWVVRGGGSPSQVIDAFHQRIGYFHLKDTLPENRYTELGEGIVDFPAALTTIRKYYQDCWLVYERDETMPDALLSARISRDYLKTLGL
jgi:sugar phosphate isomerase/epimerase